MHFSSSITIVGGGIVGCALAYELSRHGYRNIIVIEKNKSIPGLNQSSRNGGVIHAGVYYPRDVEPLKAQLCVEGNALLYEFLEKYNLPHKRTGKLILAVTERDEEYLEYVLRIAQENGVVGVERLTAKQVKKIEPNVDGIRCALFVPSTGSAALGPLLECMKALAEECGVKFLCGSLVKSISSRENSFSLEIETSNETITLNTDFLINAAGLYADEIAKMVNSDVLYEIIPTRGELYKYNSARRSGIGISGMHLYQAPFCYYTDTGEVTNEPVKEVHQLLVAGKVTKTLGVHLSPCFDFTNGTYVLANTVTVGPLKTFGKGKEDYETGLRSPADYVNRVRPFFPHLREDDLELHFSGIMAVLKGKTDFVIERDKKYSSCIHLVGMDSPAWTSCLAIARYVREMI